MENIKDMLAESGVFLRGHFVLSSMRHSDEYLQKTKIYKNPAILDDLCWEIAQEVALPFSAAKGRGIEVVVGPAMGGIILSNRVAYHLTQLYQEDVISLFTEKDEKGKQVLKRGYLTDIPGKRALIVDDVITTGHSVREIMAEIIDNGGIPAVVAAVCNRGNVQPADFNDLTLISLLDMEMNDWKEGECPLCKKKVPIDPFLGRGAEFLALHPEYPRK